MQKRKMDASAVSSGSEGLQKESVEEDEMRVFFLARAGAAVPLSTGRHGARDPGGACHIRCMYDIDIFYMPTFSKPKVEQVRSRSIEVSESVLGPETPCNNMQAMYALPSSSLLLPSSFFPLFHLPIHDIS